MFGRWQDGPFGSGLHRESNVVVPSDRFCLPMTTTVARHLQLLHFCAGYLSWIINLDVYFLVMSGSFGIVDGTQLIWNDIDSLLSDLVLKTLFGDTCADRSVELAVLSVKHHCIYSPDWYKLALMYSQQESGISYGMSVIICETYSICKLPFRIAAFFGRSFAVIGIVDSPFFSFFLLEADQQ